MRTKIVVFTAWPQLITGTQNFDILFEHSVEQATIDTFGPNINDGMERYAVRIHDRNLYPDYEYCLFVNQPEELNLEKIILETDSDHTTYVAQDRMFVLYRRNKIWQEKSIFFRILDRITYVEPVVEPLILPPEPEPEPELEPELALEPEDIPERVGIIFIDCWQIIQDTTEWKHLPPDFDLYQHMLDQLTKYRADNLVFHTGQFGSYPLADKLRPWHRQGNAVDILDPIAWVRHYQSRELRNWIVVGAHWQRCTHEKPLGFYHLLDLKKLDPELRIFSHLDCTVKFLNDDIENPICTTCRRLDYQQDSLQWKITGRIAELIGPM